MTDETLEQQLRAFYSGVASESAPTLLRRDVAAIPGVGTVPLRRWSSPRGVALLAAAALLAVALIGSAIIGAGLLRVNLSVLPSPTPVATIISSNIPSPMPTPTATLQPSPAVSARPSASSPSSGAPLIAFVRMVDLPNDPATPHCLSSETSCPESRVWLIGSDGTGGHELFADGVNYQSVMGWTPDGGHLLYSDNGNAYLTDLNGTASQPIDTGCAAPCSFDNDFSFSADGQHLVFVRIEGSSYIVATLDLATGQVFELTSTTSHRETLLPSWSPDGTKIVFWRPGDKLGGPIGPIAPITSAVFVVDADGRNMRQVSPQSMQAESPRWSADGSQIVFTSTDTQGTDVYTMQPDGSQVRRLTTDGISTAPSWTPDGRILYLRDVDGVGNGNPPAFWTMDADGKNAAELIPADVTQAASVGLWQPIGGSAIVPPPWHGSTGSQVGPPAPTPQPTPVPSLAAGFSWTGSTLSSGSGPDTATLLPDGRVLVTMACDPVAELYDPQTATFSTTGTMTAARGSATATALADGRVLIAGGGDCSDAGGILASAEVYDPATGTFSTTGGMGAKRQDHAAVLLNDGRVLIAGGTTDQVPSAAVTVVLASYQTGLIAETAAGTTLASAELYDPATGTFSPTGSMADFRSGFTATLLQDGRVLVAGGGGEGYHSSSAELYDPQTGTFTTTGSMTKTRWLHTATLLANGQVLITGGRSPNDAPYASAELYDPTSGTFTATGPMGDARQQHTATLLPDGRVLIAGGYTNDRQSWNVVASTEIYDPTTGKFSSSGSMGDARYDAVAVRLADGRVLIAGGTGIGAESLVELSSAVLYQP